MRTTLRKKLSISFLIAILGSIALVSFISNYLIEKEFSQYLIQEHQTKIDNAVSLVEALYDSQSGFSDINRDELQRYAEVQALFIKVQDMNNTIIFSTGNSYLQHKSLMENMMGPMMHNFSGMNMGEYKEATYKLVQNNQSTGILTVGYFGTSYISPNSIAFVRTLNYSLILSAIIALIFSFIISYIISRQLSNPLLKITETSNKMRAGNLEVRAIVNSNTKEIDELSSSINYLAETLNAQEMLRKRMTSDIAHELRTPLTTLKTHLEAFIDGIWEPTPDRFKIFSEEIDRLTKLVDNLRNLAKLEQSGITALNRIEVNLSNELEKIIETYRPLYLKANYELNSHITPEVAAIIDNDKFKQIMNNLLSNAYNYLKPNGRVDVSLTKEDKNIIIKVSDNGIGISEKDLPHIFERFYRSDLSRNKNTGGTGIGLTITKALIEAHNGKIFIESNLDKGTTFTIELPSVQA